MLEEKKTVLWWGHFDPNYSRNRILRQILRAQGWRVIDFSPKLSGLGDLEARWRNFAKIDLVWVPCFRQRDLSAAFRWSQRRHIPLIFDPLISAYDKQVFERRKRQESSLRARRLLGWERRCFSRADLVFADTQEHAEFFSSVLRVPKKRLLVVPVGAEESLFQPAENIVEKVQPPLEVLFYGSFLHLQGPETIIEAARLYQGPPVVWKLVGEGPLLANCQKRAEGLKNVEFLPWVPYEQLPQMIHSADLLLGIFGTTPKAGRVIPNKVYQTLACGKPLVTRSAPAYPCSLLEGSGQGIAWVTAGDPAGLAARVARLLYEAEKLSQMGLAARATYERYFSVAQIRTVLQQALERLYER